MNQAHDFSTSIIQRCPIGCEAPLEVTALILPEGPLRRCPECGQLVSACTPERYQETMQQFDLELGTMPSGKSATRHRKRIGKILRRALRSLGKPASSIRFLDVGCSSGSVLMIARELGIQEVAGVEPAEKAAETARSLGFEVFTGVLEEASFPARSFDLVSLFEVIEHLDDPRSLAQEVHRILHPGGLWLIGTGNARSWTARIQGADWEYFSIEHNGGHISFFNPESIRLLARRSGFELAYLSTKRIAMTSAPKSFPIKLAEECLALPARLLGKGHDMLAALRKPE